MYCKTTERCKGVIDEKFKALIKSRQNLKQYYARKRTSLSDVKKLKEDILEAIDNLRYDF